MYANHLNRSRALLGQYASNSRAQTAGAVVVLSSYDSAGLLCGLHDQILVDRLPGKHVDDTNLDALSFQHLVSLQGFVYHDAGGNDGSLVISALLQRYALADLEIGTVSVNGTTVEIKSISGTMYLDCELENAYSVSAGAPKNENANIYAPDFPVLSPGDNAVQFTGGITSVAITPRWWEL